MVTKAKPFYKRALIIGVLLLSITIGISIILYFFNQNIVLYYSPSELQSIHANNKTIRLGGSVKKGSIKYITDEKSQGVEFFITDNKSAIKTVYYGLIPSLFQEGQEAVAYGTFNNDGTFIAKELLAKHDEYYKPKQQ